jgi:hypothetical protein
MSRNRLFLGQVALQQSLPPLHRMAAIVKDVRRQNVKDVPALDSEGPGAPSAWLGMEIIGTGATRHPLACNRFPGVAGYTAALLHAFRRGARRASPVALSILVAVLSLHTPPDRRAASVSCVAPCGLHP